MKKLLQMLGMLMLGTAIMFTACDDDDDNNDNSGSQTVLSGHTFTSTDSDYFAFDKSGNGVKYSDGESGILHSGTYTMTENAVNITLLGQPIKGTYDPETETLSIWGSTYFKEGASIISIEDDAPEYLKEVAEDFYLDNETPKAMYSGVVNETIDGVQYNFDCTLALFFDGSAILAMEKSNSGTPIEVIGYYSYEYSKDGSIYTLGADGKTYSKPSEGSVFDRTIDDGCVQYKITISDNKIVAISE